MTQLILKRGSANCRSGQWRDNVLEGGIIVGRIFLSPAAPGEGPPVRPFPHTETRCLSAKCHHILRFERDPIPYERRRLVANPSLALGPCLNLALRNEPIEVIAEPYVEPGIVEGRHFKIDLAVVEAWEDDIQPSSRAASRLR